MTYAHQVNFIYLHFQQQKHPYEKVAVNYITISIISNINRSENKVKTTI